jgi:hypothetical protein
MLVSDWGFLWVNGLVWEAYEAGCEAHCLVFVILGGEVWYYLLQG